MFRKRPAIQAATTALIVLCYLMLAGMSAVHEVTHLVDAVRQYSAATYGNPSATDSHGSHSQDDSQSSIPCFLCLNGHPYSILTYASYTPHLITTQTAERIVAVPDLISSLYQLPSLRAPPALS